MIFFSDQCISRRKVQKPVVVTENKTNGSLAISVTLVEQQSLAESSGE